MKQEVFWKNPGYKERARLRKNITCDYLIVGGGIAGVMTAYFLHKHGAKKIVLIERDFIGGGATGKAAGIYIPVPEQWYMDHYTRYLGIKKTATYWISHLAAFHALKNIILKERINCEADYEPMFCLESPYVAIEEVFKEYKALKWFHTRVKLLLKKDLEKEVHSSLFACGFKLWKSLSVNPLKFVQNFSRTLEKNGIRLYENTPLVRKMGNVAFTPEGTITFMKIISAVDSETKNSEMESVKTSIAVTEQLPHSLMKKISTEEKMMFWDVRKRSYHYGKVTKDGRLLIGYGDTHVKRNDNTLDSAHLREIRRFLERLLPEDKIAIEYAWSGIYGNKKGLLPLVKIEKDGATIAGCASQVTAVMLADYISRKIMSKNHMLDSVFV